MYLISRSKEFLFGDSLRIFMVLYQYAFSFLVMDTAHNIFKLKID